MKITVSSFMNKIFSQKDCLPIENAKCLKNETFAFQLFLQADEDVTAAIRVQSDLAVNVYSVKKMKGDIYRMERANIDDYYVYALDHMYPELLQKADSVCLKQGEEMTLFFELAGEKSAGEHEIKVQIGKDEVVLPLTVLDTKLEDTDLILTHWFHMDAIADYYHLPMFSDAFFVRFEQFLKAYVKLGNTMILVPTFTPPLDTRVGSERTTAQLVKIKKDGGRYEFDFSLMEKYIRLCMGYGVKYFEFSHLFTQWGGTNCPKIMVEENGVTTDHFGWNVESTSKKYEEFLTQYFNALLPVLDKLGIKKNAFLHLTDEPGMEHLERYEKLSALVKKLSGGLPVMDALSHYDLAKSNIDMPAVATQSGDLSKFTPKDIMLYYCIDVDGNYLSNRYFHMTMHRTAILGMQLYETGVSGFLHWGFNFYNTALSIEKLDPYKNACGGVEFAAGDTFVVYPGDETVEYSIRYFALLRAFEDYRLLKTVEKRVSREDVLALLHEEGISGVRTYPRDVKAYEKFREKLYAVLG